MIENMLLLYNKTHKSAAPQSPALDLSFTNAVLPAECSFARASKGTYFNSSGVMQIAANDTPRFDYAFNKTTSLWEAAGLLVEPSRTNLCYNSQDLSTRWIPTGLAVSSLSVPFMNEAQNVKCTEDTTLNAHQIILSNPRPVIKNTTNCVSCFSIKGTRRYIKIVVAGGSYTGYAVIDTDTWEVTYLFNFTDIKCMPISDAAARIYLYDYFSNNSADMVVCMAGSSSATPSSFNEAYTGDGSTIIGTAFQVEQGFEYPTSYIPTTTATATRAADQLSFTIPTGISALRFTFDDDSTQDINVSSGSYTVDPTALNRYTVKRIQSL